MPWIPELFSAPALERVLADRRHARVPFFAGMMAGEIDALVGSFAGEPELHHPVRGRVKGVAAFERFVSELRTWLTEHSAAPEDVDFVLTPGRGVEELILHLDTDDGRSEVPVAIASAHDERGRIVEQRVYFSSWPLTGGHAIRPPVLQPRHGLEEPDAVGDYQRALAAGDADAVMAALEPDASVREPAGRAYTHRGADELRALYERFFSNGGGVPREHCAVTDDGRACAWSTTSSPGAARRCRRKLVWPSTCAATAAGSR